MQFTHHPHIRSCPISERMAQGEPTRNRPFLLRWGLWTRRGIWIWIICRIPVYKRKLDQVNNANSVIICNYSSVRSVRVIRVVWLVRAVQVGQVVRVTQLVRVVYRVQVVQVAPATLLGGCVERWSMWCENCYGSQKNKENPDGHIFWILFLKNSKLRPDLLSKRNIS